LRRRDFWEGAEFWKGQLVLRRQDFFPCTADPRAGGGIS
jgi:hypothetical protein